jgi:ADP-heptose:LPS heptosyltransferase
MPKILIIRFSSIGDIVLTTPVIRNLKKQMPDAEVHYCIKQKFKTVVENNPYVDKIHVFDKKLGDLIKQLRQENFDYIIDLHNNFRSLLIKTALGKKSFSFDKLNLKKWLFVNFKINKLPSVHIVDRYMATVKPLNIFNDNLGLDYFIPSQDKINLVELPENFRNGYIAFAIGAQHYTKRLPKEKILEVCEKIEFPIILLGDANDNVVGQFVEEKLKEKNKIVFNACGKYNLNKSASVINQSLYFFSHDTGLMHIAAAFKKEIYSIWGNTSPKFGMYPYQTKYYILENNLLSCRPCSKIGYSKCPKGHFKCMVENPLVFEIPAKNLV